ncbi:MAG: Gfo/Idh/MocA family oxidoreductase [Betaproteobacteria bacterium]|nr:Gfo/Idh/MocA family oxidoreductase [Betaproteobacteria bacterium]
MGVAGLGRGLSLMLPTLRLDPRIELVACADPREAARDKFAIEFGARAYASTEELCDDAGVELVYVATPHQYHASHACLAARKGKHLLVEKPMALTVHECLAMIAASRKAGVQLIVGHSHSFDAPIQRAREIIASGAVGKVRMINAFYYTDFLYRPRRPEELITREGGGVIFNQASHQIDVVCYLAGGRALSVRAMTGIWDPTRSTEGAYSATLAFESGAFATLTYSGYAHFDSDEFRGWVGEGGQQKDPARHGAARRALAAATDARVEARMKNDANYGGDAYQPGGREPEHHAHFGEVIVSCEHADLRPVPEGVMIHGDAERLVDKVPLRQAPRAEVIDELYAAIVEGHAPVHGGEWALGTIEVCLAMLRSARTGGEVKLKNQIALKSRIAQRAN